MPTTTPPRPPRVFDAEKNAYQRSIDAIKQKVIASAPSGNSIGFQTDALINGLTALAASNLSVPFGTQEAIYGMSDDGEKMEIKTAALAALENNHKQLSLVLIDLFAEVVGEQMRVTKAFIEKLHSKNATPFKPRCSTPPPQGRKKA
jgi:hypothetical protein